MDIFNNDHEVLQLGSLTIENQHDCVVIVGDVQIDKSLDGKKQAAMLYDFAKALLTRFDELDEHELSKPKDPQTPSKNVKNPFD
ncbi:MAG: hypothetical protein Q4A69_06425 [Moraxella sp.]|nr:hypothetical protein [Moraxella sp.]